MGKWWLIARMQRRAGIPALWLARAPGPSASRLARRCTMPTQDRTAQRRHAAMARREKRRSRRRPAHIQFPPGEPTPND